MQEMSKHREMEKCLLSSCFPSPLLYKRKHYSCDVDEAIKNSHPEDLLHKSLKNTWCRKRSF